MRRSETYWRGMWGEDEEETWRQTGVEELGYYIQIIFQVKYCRWEDLKDLNAAVSRSFLFRIPYASSAALV